MRNFMVTRTCGYINVVRAVSRPHAQCIAARRWGRHCVASVVDAADFTPRVVEAGTGRVLPIDGSVSSDTV